MYVSEFDITKVIALKQILTRKIERLDKNLIDTNYKSYNQNKTVLALPNNNIMINTQLNNSVDDRGEGNIIIPATKDYYKGEPLYYE